MPFSLPEMEELQAMIRERDAKVSELTELRSIMELERQRAEKLREELEAVKHEETSERQRLVGALPFQLFVDKSFCCGPESG